MPTANNVTLTQALAELPTQQSRLVSAANVRDGVNSAFGAVQVVDPTPADDQDGTAGHGSYDAPSQWMNTADKSIWVCFQGAHNAADWAEVALVRNLPPPPPPGVTIPVAKMAYAAGTPLSGFPLWGSYRVQAGDTILTWDGVSRTTWGIWVAAAGAWTRATTFPAGVTFNGPAYIWVADEFFFFPDEATLVTLAPTWSSATPPPGSWVVGVDSVRMQYASPVSTVGAGTFILVTPIVGPANQTLYTVNYTGPTTLDQWASFSGPISVVNVTSGYPAGNLSPGTFPAGVLLPAGQLSGTVPATSLPSLNGIAGSSGPLNASNVGSGYPYSDLSGAPSPGGMQSAGPLVSVITTTPQTIFSLTGSNGLMGSIVVKNTGGFTITLSGTYTDAFGNVSSISGLAGIAPGSNISINWAGSGSPAFGGTGLGLPTQITLQANVGVSTTTISAKAQWVQ